MPRISPEWIAILAAYLPWLVVLWKKWVKRPRLEFYENAKIELGYSDLGPTIALIGTCRALNGDIFVKDLALAVVKKRDESRYEFSLVAYRSAVLNSSSLTPVSIEVPSGFIVRPDHPVVIYPVFSDRVTHATIQVAVEEHARKMIELQDNYFAGIQGYTDADDVRDLLSLQQRNEFVEIVRGQSFHTDLFTVIDGASYWDPGEYQFLLTIKTSEKKIMYSKTYNFSITQKDSDTLRLNAVDLTNTSFDQFLGKPVKAWNCIYPTYT